MNDEPENPWNRLIQAARQTSPGKGPISSTPRVTDIRRRVMSLIRAILWRRISLMLALLAGIAWLVIFLLLRSHDPQPTLIPFPPDALQDTRKP